MRITWLELDAVANKIGQALGKSAIIERGGTGVKTKLLIDGHPVHGVKGASKKKCYEALCVFLEGIEHLVRAAKEGKASEVRS